MILRITLGVLLAVATGFSAELQQSTLDAWTAYIAQENLQLKKRAENLNAFFWIDQNPQLLARVRAGEVVSEPVGTQCFHRVPNGLIHHWISSAFIPKASAEDVLSVARDYEHYKDFYKPGVDSASTIKKTEDKDEFTIRFVNSSLLSHSFIEGDYVSDFVRISENRWYITSETTKMTSDGSGYIWRLFSTARFENRDGGVLVEIEAIALSRDIPASLRWFVDPIVKKVSRESIEKSLSQTADATRTHAHQCEVASSRIIESGTCSRHADNSDIRDQKLSSYASR